MNSSPFHLPNASRPFGGVSIIKNLTLFHKRPFLARCPTQDLNTTQSRASVIAL